MNNPKLIVVFYGRFQPPHMGHIQVYKKLTSVFGAKNVYIGTSNKIEKEHSPLSFKWKKKLLIELGVPSNNIIQTTKNYNSKEIQNILGVNPNNTVFIVAIGKKDSNRLSNAEYFEKYTKNIKLESMSNKSYYYIIPNVKMGGKVMSATDVRSTLRKNKLTNTDYSYLKQSIGATKAQVDKLKPMFEHYIEDGDLLMEVAKNPSKFLRKYKKYLPK